MNKVEIKRVDEDEITYWQVWLNDQQVSDYPTFRRAMGCAKRLTSDHANIILDPLDK